jgi:4-hydroxybenzoate polyprenyltransferase
MDHATELTLFEYAIRGVLIGLLCFALTPFLRQAGKRRAWLTGGAFLAMSLVLFIIPFTYLFIAYPYLGSGVALGAGLLFQVYSLHLKPKGKKIMRIAGWVLLVVALTLWVGGCYIDQENVRLLDSRGN